MLTPRCSPSRRTATSSTDAASQPPAVHSFLFEPLFTDRQPSTSTSRCCWRCSAPSSIVGLLLGRVRASRRSSRASCRWSPRRGYDFVRRGIVYETIGKKDGEKYVPLLVSLFFFVWMMNLWSIIPVAQFPVTSSSPTRSAWPLIVYVIWMSLTFKQHGFVGGFKNIIGYDRSARSPMLPCC